MTDIPSVFAQYRGPLGALITAVRNQLGDPNAARGQGDRLHAWCMATEQFLDAGYWSAALDVHLAGQRAAAADRERQLADAAAADQRNAAAAAARDAQERAAMLNLTHPTQNL